MVTGVFTKQWRRSVSAVLLAVLAVLLGACGGDDQGTAESSTVEDGGENAGSATTGGDSGPQTGGTETDDDFPIARPDGLVLDALADSGIDSPGQRQLYYPGGDYDRVVAFYDDWTANDGGWTRAESGGVVVYTESDTENVRTISITPNHDPGAQADGPVTYVLLIAPG